MTEPGAIPEVVPVSVPGFADSHFRLLSVGGKDFIANALWRAGWQGCDGPLPDVFAALAAAAGSSLVLDIGANTGFYSLLSAAVNPAVEVHAFEPFPPVMELLDKNLLLNGSTRIRRFDVAVSDAAGIAKLYIPLQGHGLVETSASLESDFKDAHSAVLEVPKVTIDEHMKAYPEKRVGLIKIDVEGHENEVLRGAKATIETYRPPIVLEVLDMIDTDETNRFLKSIDYVSYSFRDGRLEPEDEARCIFRMEAWNHLVLPRERSRPAELTAFM